MAILRLQSDFESGPSLGARPPKAKAANYATITYAD